MKSMKFFLKSAAEIAKESNFVLVQPNLMMTDFVCLQKIEKYY